MSVDPTTNSENSLPAQGKGKEKPEESFADFLETHSSEKGLVAHITEYDLSEEEIKEIEAAAGQSFSKEPSYSVTDEEAEYFREKYGGEYNEDTVSDLFFELAEKGIIDTGDAIDATCCGFYRRVEITVIGAPPGVDPMKWAACPPGEDAQEWRKTHKFSTKLGTAGHAKHRDIFPEEYKEFKQDHDKNVITWEDFIQEQRDFYEYMRNRDTIYDAEGNQRPNNPLKGYDERLEGLERAAGIIKRIFG